MKPKTALPFMLLFLLTGKNILSQDRWNIDDGRTTVYGMSQYKYAPVPVDKNNFINPNKETRVEKTPIGTLLITPNFRVLPNPNTVQAEVILVRNKQVPNVMYGAAKTFWPPGVLSGGSAGTYVTTNGGLNWFGWDTLNGPPVPIRGSDPAPVIDKNGTFIITTLLADMTLIGNYSTNHGQSWSAYYPISIPGDKNLSGTDDMPSSPFYGRTYTAWTAWGTLSDPRPIKLSYTTNSGVSWSLPIQVNNSTSGSYSQGVDIRCGLNGEVYLVWAAPIRSAPFTEDFDGFAKSTNGSINWTANENVFDANGIRGFLPTKGNIRVNSFPRMDVDKTGGPRNGWIYTVGCDINLPPSGSDPDIIFHRSTNGGVSWSSAIRVNQDPLNNGAIQFFPAIEVDDNGGINIVYYDDRNVGGQLTQVYVSRSTDGGNTWADLQVSDHAFVVAPIPPSTNGFMGDYIGICYSNGKLWPFWMDNYSGNCQVWTTAVDIITGVEPFVNYMPDEYSLSQNYPNPFNPSTAIKYTLPKEGRVKLAVYDMLGKEVSSLVNQTKQAGSYQEVFDASGLTSGVYFYKLTAGDYSETRKMMLVK